MDLPAAARRDSQVVTVRNNLNTVVLSLAKMEGRAWNRAFMATSVSVILVILATTVQKTSSRVSRVPVRMVAPVRTVRKGSTVVVPRGSQGGGVTSSQIPAFIRTSVKMVQPVETEPVSAHNNILDLIVEK